MSHNRIFKPDRDKLVITMYRRYPDSMICDASIETWVPRLKSQETIKLAEPLDCDRIDRYLAFIVARFLEGSEDV